MTQSVHFPKSITADTLGDLFAWHHATFGDFHMEEDDDDNSGDDKNKGGGDFKAPATQAELDRIIGERLAREREKYVDYDDLKKKAEAHDKALEDAMTDAEKKVAEARREGEAAAAEKANDRLKRSEIRALAAQAKFRDPSDALSQIDLSQIKIGDDGEVDADAIKSELKRISEAKPYLVDDGKTPPKPDHSQGGDKKTSDAPSVGRGREMFAERRKGSQKAS